MLAGFVYSLLYLFMPVKLSRLKVMRALPWLDEMEAVKVFAEMKGAQESKRCKRFSRRFYDMEGNNDLTEEIRLFRALQLVWESSGSRYRFEEVDDFSIGVDGERLGWSGHSEKDTNRKSSKPHKLFRVFQIDEAGNEELLPLNVGFSGKKSMHRRLGGGEKLGHRLRTINGGPTSGAVISAFVMDDKHPDYDALRDCDTRSKVETALMGLLKYAGKDVILSSILFNLRDNPLKGLYLALTGLYAKGEHTVFPVNSVFLKSKREGLSHTKDAGDGKNNGTVWVAYLNEDSVDLDRLPNLNLSPLKGQEMEVIMQNPSIDVMSAAHKRFAAFINASFGVGPLDAVADDGLIGFLPMEVMTQKAILQRRNVGRGFTTAIHDIVSKPDRERLLAMEAHSTAGELNKLLKEKGESCLVYMPERTVKIRNKDGTFREKVLKRLDAKKTAENLDPNATILYGIGNERYSLGYDPNLGLCFKSTNDVILRSPGRVSQLKYVPPELLDDKALMTRNSQAKTPLHIIAENSELKLLPKGVLTKKMLLCQDGSGATPISAAVRAGCLAQIPIEIVPKTLFHAPCHDKTNAPKWRRGRWTLIDLAVCSGTAKTIPQDVMLEAMRDEKRAQELRELAKISGKTQEFACVEQLHTQQLEALEPLTAEI